MQAIKDTKRSYYKYSYSAFTQPVLSEDGNIFGDSFAVYEDPIYNNNNAYKAFDGDSSTLCEVSCPGYIIIYNPNPIKIPSITIKNYSSLFPRTGNVQYSDNYSTWTTINDWSSNDGSGATWTINLSSTGYHKWHKINISTSTAISNPAAAIVEITLSSAEERIPIESTSSDYDFYEDVDVYYCTDDYKVPI